MESSNLQSLVTEILEPLRANPDGLLRKLLGDANYYKINGLIQSPIIKNILPIKLDPAQFIVGVVDKLETLPPEFWAELEIILMGVLQGDSESLAKAKTFFGVVVNEH